MSIEAGLAKTIWWLKLHTRLPLPICPWCVSGRRLERRGFWRYEHPVDGEWERCREPSFWIIHLDRRGS